MAILASSLLLALETEEFAREPRPMPDSLAQTINSTAMPTKVKMEKTIVKRWLVIVDGVLTLFLTLEFLARFTLSRKKLLFLRQPLSIADILGFVPAWIGLILYIRLIRNKPNEETLSHMYNLSCLKTLRLLRLGHIILHFKRLRTVALAVRHTTKEMSILFAVVCAEAFVIGLLMFYVSLLHEDTFKTVFEAQWWALITIATVGYGDFYPTSSPGRFVGVICCLLGLATVAMATSIFVNNFLYIYKCAETFDRMKRIRFMKKQNKTNEIK
jgi:hypothetical protein